MKRVIKASTRDGLRVVNIGLDVVIPEDADGDQIADAIQRIVNMHYGDGIRVASAACAGEEVTDIYRKQWPEEIFI